MRRAWLVLVAFWAASCSMAEVPASQSLAQARAAHPMRIAVETRAGMPPPAPPEQVLRRMTYPAPAGEMAAYITPPPADGVRHPAILWISGGDSNTIDGFWLPADPDNDQTAAAFRDAGIVTMYPSTRGGNDNPGYREYFYGEIDDILAAAEYLAKQPHVDPDRIYLGGHSTGGTTVLLAAELSDRFRGVFSFGPVYDIRVYGDLLQAPITDEMQARVRSPGYWLSSIRSPVFVFEGRVQGNTEDLKALAKDNRNPQVKLWAVDGATHFSILAPVTALVAKKIVDDAGAQTRIAFTQSELDAAVARMGR